ncbi:hypothetical protein V1638_04210 [Pseudarthrobacter sp. J64]|uniref:hypothetical protein n=1 Tax=Pseudarthrobacter sp. J64 TaxID=3116485 RepID=UPI002E800495|nr:hypothetical protein [Pseudarthrobacter sp. J64]MEE2568600.1 hypothetical protein [Pseudarthrobacter sp. J64]
MATPRNKRAEEPAQGSSPDTQLDETPDPTPDPQTDQTDQTPPAATDQPPADPPTDPEPEQGTAEPEPETVQVRMRIKVSGTRNGQDWPNPGDILDVPEGEAMSLIANGYAIFPDEEETATADTSTVETATTSGRRSIKASLDKVDGAS